MKCNLVRWCARVLALAIAAVLAGSTARAEVIGFDDLPTAGSSLPAGNPGSQWYGNAIYNDPPTSSSFTSGGITFHNTRQYFHSSWPPLDGSDMDYWSGWAYSNRCDTGTTGMAGQFTAMGSGVSGHNGANSSSQYAVAYPYVYGADSGINFSVDTNVKGAYVTNNAYVYDIIMNGDLVNQFSRKFGDGDYFKLTIVGKDGAGAEVGSVDFYLADYRGGKQAIVKDWTLVDLSVLPKPVRRLEFEMESTDYGDFGSNTPTYFAMDNLTVVPEPSTFVLLVAGSLAALAWRRRRKA